MTATQELDERLGTVFTALADPTRRWLLATLAERGSGTATMLARQLPISRQAVVKHLGVLDDAGLVTGSRAGREMRFTVRTAELAYTASWLADTARQWEDRLAVIKRLAEAPLS